MPPAATAGTVTDWVVLDVVSVAKMSLLFILLSFAAVCEREAYNSPGGVPVDLMLAPLRSGYS